MLKITIGLISVMLANVLLGVTLAKENLKRKNF